jgi:hypothetical protein
MTIRNRIVLSSAAREIDDCLRRETDSRASFQDIAASQQSGSQEFAQEALARQEPYKAPYQEPYQTPD